MKHEEKWHSWPEEIPPEGKPLRIEIWNNLQNAYELGVGAVYEGEWCYYDPVFKLNQPLFKYLPPQIFWRLWEDEEDEE